MSKNKHEHEFKLAYSNVIYEAIPAGTNMGYVTVILNYFCACTIDNYIAANQAMKTISEQKI